MPPRHIKLLRRARNSANGWKRRDLLSLYKGFGFVEETDGKHVAVQHSEYPQLVAQIPHGSRALKAIYVKTAIGLIEQLQALQGETDDEP